MLRGHAARVGGLVWLAAICACAHRSGLVLLTTRLTDLILSVSDVSRGNGAAYEPSVALQLPDECCRIIGAGANLDRGDGV